MLDALFLLTYKMPRFYKVTRCLVALKVTKKEKKKKRWWGYSKAKGKRRSQDDLKEIVDIKVEKEQKTCWGGAEKLTEAILRGKRDTVEKNNSNIYI